uniref:Uncharacterized protein n=1 Tax=Staphylococcus aureus TaxID=1280 RepID=Q936I1_STAAU|nr:unknown [Staphylococcus aureus]
MKQRIYSLLLVRCILEFVNFDLYHYSLLTPPNASTVTCANSPLNNLLALLFISWATLWAVSSSSHSIIMAS